MANPPSALPLKRVPAIFYRTEAGNEPLRAWLRSLDVDDRRRIGGDVKLAEYAWPIGMPTFRLMGDGLHEIRTALLGGRIARVLFYIDARSRMVLLHGFIKKSRPTIWPSPAPTNGGTRGVWHDRHRLRLQRLCLR